MWFVADRQSPSGLCIQHVRNGKHGPKPLPAESVLRKTKASSGQRPQDAFLLCFFLLEKSLCFICCLRLKSILCKPIPRLTMKNQKISRFARPTLTPNLLNFERTPLTETPNSFNLRPETSDHLSPKPQTPDRFNPKPGLDSPYFNPSIRYVAYSAIATCTLDLVICTLEHTFSAFWL